MEDDRKPAKPNGGVATVPPEKAEKPEKPEKPEKKEALFTKTGVNAGPRTYRNNLVFLMAEGSRVQGLKDAVKSLMAWERVQKDIEQEQTNLAQAGGISFTEMKRKARDSAAGVPAEFTSMVSTGNFR